MASNKNKNKYENDFEHLEKIGEGAFGYVTKVKDKNTGAFYAIKRIEIKGDLSQEDLKEISILSQLSKVYVINYIDSWTEEKVIDKQLNTYVYIQMELCSQNLESIIDLINTSFDERFKTIKYYIRSQLLVEMIECLKHLHSLTPPIIHRDLKPQNFLVTDGKNERTVKLCDFGLSKPLENSQNTRGVGTQDFMAPEITDYESYNQESGKSRYNEKCDIYSMGVIATKLFGIKDRIKKIRELKKETKDKYSVKYSDENLKERFPKLLEIISHMVSKERDVRPDCNKLLGSAHEWTLNPNIVKSDENYEEFIGITENNDKLKVLQRLLK